ncbi:DNAJC21 (predicted), partial [Pycnogonum litorale]
NVASSIHEIRPKIERWSIGTVLAFVMKCHYEILGLPRDVEFDELKKTYRKLALQWHPDKNPENIEEATAQFRLIQQAYDVLSDPQERAWYDRHREVILKGGIDDDFKDNCVDVFPYFTVSCFSGYDDSEKGFYSIYREVFDKIAAEDMEFLLEKSTDIEIPKFGDSTSSYEEVVHPFYAHWLSYCTLRSYVWVETYDIREAPNRRVVRLMEKENKKLRDQAKKKRNEEVRTLVEFVRKRDKRVQAYRKVLEEKAALNAKKTAENRKKQLQERQKMLEGYQESEWSSMSTLEADLKEIEATLDKQFESDDIDKTTDDDDDGLYCVACEKAFRNQKGMENHIKSKKHKENFELLKTLMEEEEISLQKNVDCASDDSNSRMINNESNEDTDNNFELQSNQFEFDKHNDSESAEMSNDEYYT